MPSKTIAPRQFLDLPLVRQATSVALGLTIVCVVALGLPTMPASGLDSSWMLGMNEATGHGLGIGTDVVFNFGPYASVFTMQYHPLTDRMMVAGAAWLALCYVLVATVVAPRSTVVGLGLLFIFAAFMLARDPLFLGYGLLYVLACRDLSQRPRLSNPQLAGVAIAASALGLLPIVKSSYLFTCVAAWVGGAILLSRGDKGTPAMAVAGLSPPLSVLIAWSLAGQPVACLIPYLKNALVIIGGYADAMSLPGEPRDIIIYLAAAALILATVASARFESFVARGTVFLMFALTLLIGAKAGFTRHDGHAVIAASVIGVAGVCTGLLRTRIPAIASGLAGISALLAIDAAYLRLSPAHLVHAPMRTYADTVLVLKKRWEGDTLRREFEQAMAKIKAEHPLPLLTGTSDIYPHDLADLIASGNHWQPRPVIQSYQAYGPLLAAEKEHLSGVKAPANIFFSLQPLDDHFPLMDSGAAIPEILARYTAENIHDNLLVLRRRPAGDQMPPHLATIGDVRPATFGRPVEVPTGNRIVFAVFTFERNAAGRLMSLAFKTPPMTMRVELSDGSAHTFRIIPGMVEQGFILSPLVADIDDLAHLFIGDALRGRTVTRFSIAQDEGLGRMPGGYQVAFYDLAFEPIASPTLRLGAFESVSPAGGAPVARTCTGALDQLNGEPADRADLARGNFKAEGWLALDVARGTVPQATYLTLKDAEGRLLYLRVRKTSRPDVAEAYRHAALGAAGFSASAATSGLAAGPYTLGFAAVDAGTLYACTNLDRTLRLK